MEGYGYTYPPFPMRPPESPYPDHGDVYGEYYGGEPMKEASERRRSPSPQRRSRSRRRVSDSVTKSHSRSRSASVSKSRSRTRSRSRSRSRSHSLSRSQSRSETQMPRLKEVNYREPSFLDAFRVLYLTSGNKKRNPSKFLATKKRQDRIQKILKSDELGSKKWLFYPRTDKIRNDPDVSDVPGCRDSVDQRIKVDGDFFRKYKKNKKVDTDAPIAKLKWWELIFYKKLGFVQAV